MVNRSDELIFHSQGLRRSAADLVGSHRRIRLREILLARLRAKCFDMEVKMQKFIKDSMPFLAVKIVVLTFLTILIAAAFSGCTKALRTGNFSDKQKTYILYGNDDPEDLEILKHRLDLFAGKDRYSLELNGGAYTLRLPASLSSSDQLLTQCLEELLTSPCRISAACSPLNTGRNLSMARIITVEQPVPENCRGMKVEELSADNEISGKDGPLTLDMNTPPTRRLILRFDEETADRMRIAIGQGCNLCLKDNTCYVGYETNRYSSEWPLTVCPDDPDSFYVDYNETDFLYGNEDLFYYNLTHEVLSHPYNYCEADEILWEDPEESTSSGSNQCREDDLESSFLFFQLSSFHKPSADERSQVRMLLLRRLDLLSSPYAYGQTADGSICVKIQSPRINMAVLTLLASCSRSPMRLTIPGSSQKLSPKYMHVQYDPNTPALEVSLPSEAASELNDMLHAQMQSSTGANAPFQQIPIFLCAGSTPVARCTTDVFFDPANMTFREIYLPEDSGEIQQFTDLVQESANLHQSSLPDLDLDYLYLHDSKSDTFGASVIFPLQQRSPVSESDIAAKIQKILPEAQVELSDDSRTLTIHMNLPVDDKLVSRIFSLVPELFEACALKKQFFEHILIYPLDPAGDERCLLTFDKKTDGSVSFLGLMCNGRLTPYKEEIAESINQDSFFKAMIGDYGTGWIYRDF